MTENLQAFIEQFYRIVNRTQRMRTKKISFDGTPELQTASIHFIEMIGKHDQTNMTQLAQLLGVTKGAVSQMAKTLEEKHLIRRMKGADNGKDTYFALTDEGRRVFEGHELLHEQMYTQIEGILSELTPEDLEKAERIFSNVEECLENYQHTL